MGGLALAAVVGALGLYLLADRPGLEVEYFAIEPEWRGRPVDTDVGPPRLASRRAAGYRLLSHELFSIRWSGWLRIERAGRYRFSIDSDDRAYLKLDGEELVDTGAGRDARRIARRLLAPGAYPLEIGLSQTGGPTGLEAFWIPPGETAAALPADALYDRRPTRLRRALRRWLAPVSPALRRLLGAGLLLAGAAGLLGAGRRLWTDRGAGPMRRAVDADRGRLADSPSVRAGLLLVVLALVWWIVYRFTARTIDGDDVRYLDAAMFDRKQPWILNRYSHVYLVRLFVWLAGDGFAAGRHYWSFAFAGTVTALVVAARSLGAGLQLRTLALTLFLLFAQVSIWGTIGAAFADYTTMLYVTAGVAAFLYGHAREEDLRGEWPALAVGALTVLAYRSKETGLILLWLLPLLAWWRGRLDGRRFARRALWWLAGAATASLVLMTLDGLLLGDFWFSLRPASVEALQSVNFADKAQAGRSTGGWMDVIWQAGIEGRPRDHSLRHLSLLVVAAAVLAAAQRRRLETVFLHLMPMGFLALLILAHVRGNFVHSPRHLIPMLPVACLLAAKLFHDLGLEEPPWGGLLSKPGALTLGTAAAVAWIVVAPYRIGELDAASFVPAAALARLGWAPGDFVDQTLGPLLVLALVTAGALSLRAARARLLVALLCLPFLFGTAFELTRLSLARRGAVQRGNLILHPWDAFGDEIAAARPRQLLVSSEIFRRYGMIGQRVNRNRIAGIYFRRDGFEVKEFAVPPPQAYLFIASRREVERWREEIPGFEVTATFDASGELALVRRVLGGAP